MTSCRADRVLLVTIGLSYGGAIGLAALVHSGYFPGFPRAASIWVWGAAAALGGIFVLLAFVTRQRIARSRKKLEEMKTSQIELRQMLDEVQALFSLNKDVDGS